MSEKKQDISQEMKWVQIQSACTEVTRILSVFLSNPEAITERNVDYLKETLKELNARAKLALKTPWA